MDNCAMVAAIEAAILTAIFCTWLFRKAKTDPTGTGASWTHIDHELARASNVTVEAWKAPDPGLVIHLFGMRGVVLSDGCLDGYEWREGVLVAYADKAGVCHKQFFTPAEWDALARGHMKRPPPTGDVDLTTFGTKPQG